MYLDYPKKPPVHQEDREVHSKLKVVEDKKDQLDYVSGYK